MFKRLFCGGGGRFPELLSSLNADIHDTKMQTGALIATMLR